MVEKHLPAIRRLKSGEGLSLHSLDSETNFKIMGRRDLLDMNKLIPAIKSDTNHIRVAIVVNRYNKDEVLDIIKFLSKYEDIKYIQVRRISTDTRESSLIQDVEIYENLFQEVLKKYPIKERFYGAERIEMFGKETCWWRTVETSSNSINYFTDGTISDNYFVVEGYLNNYKKA